MSGFIKLGDPQIKLLQLLSVGGHKFEGPVDKP